MKKILSLLLVCLLVVYCTTILCCCKKNDDNTIRLCEVTHSLFYTPQYVAMALGYFEEVGLTVEISNGSGADNVMTALLTNEADIGLMGCEANIYVYLQGKKDYPKVIAQFTQKDGSFLVGRTNVANFDYANMQNSTVLMGRTGGMPAMIMQYVLNNHGYTNGTNINMDYTIQFGALAPAFSSGTGDYVPLFEPTASQLVQEGRGYILSAIGNDSGNIPYTCYSATDSYVNTHTEQVTKFITAVWKAIDYVNTHSANNCAQLVARYFEGTSIDLIEKSIQNYQKIDAWNNTPVTDTTAFANLQDIMQNAGELSVRVDYDKIVNNTIANTVNN